MVEASARAKAITPLRPGPRSSRTRRRATVASLVPVIGPCAFSSLASTRSGCPARRTVHARYRKARAPLSPRPPRVCQASSFFPDLDRARYDDHRTYQKLGNWTPHVEITRRLGSTVTLPARRLIKKRHRYEYVIAPPP